MINHLESCIDIVTVDPRFRYIGCSRYTGWDDKVKIAEGCLGVVDGTDDEGDIGAVVTEVSVYARGPEYLQFLHDIVSDPSSERSREGNDWCVARKEDAYGTDGSVLFAEGCTPVRYAVRFVDDKRVDTVCELGFAQDSVNKPLRGKHLWGKQYDSIFPGDNFLSRCKNMIERNLMNRSTCISFALHPPCALFTAIAGRLNSVRNVST